MSSGPPRQVVYGPESQLRRPRQFARSTKQGLVASLQVAPRLASRGLRSQYRNSLLGYFWIIGPSLAVAGVWLYLHQVDVVNSGDTRIPYGVFVLVGTLLWMSFTEALNAPIQQLTNASNLLSKVNFPPESLLLAGLLTVSINSLARLTLVIPVFLFSGVGPSWSLLLFPAGLAGLLLLGFTVGLLLAPIGALYRDVGQTLTIATSFLFLVTPVAYTNSGRGKSRISAAINPIGPMLVTARDWLTGGPARPSGAWFAILALELVFLAVGWILFRLAVPHLVDRISI